MKLNRKVTRLAASVLATAMFACATALPAMAAPASYTATDTFEITKKLTVAANSFQPTASFGFTVTKGTITDAKQLEGGYYDGVDGAVEMTTAATFEADENTTPSITEKDVTAKATFTVYFGTGTSCISHAGIYKYQVEEIKDPKISGVTYSTKKYDLYITVVNTEEDGLEVSSCQMVDPEATDPTEDSSKIDEFVNKYDNRNDTDPDPDFNTLTLTKNIEGTGAALNGEFNFTIAITGSDPTHTTKYYYKSTKGDEGTIPANGSATTITLSDDETVTVYGLLDDDRYTITETEANADRYETTVKKDTDGAVNYTDASSVLTNVKLSDVAGDDDNVNITVINTRDIEDIPATGIIMNVAPYVLMVVIAAAGCFVFLRKRRDD